MSSARLSRAFKTLAAFALCVFSVQSLAEPSCTGDGGMHAANAFVLANPVYAVVFGGDLRAYVEKNRAQFRQGGDAARCMRALSSGFMSTALKLYDPVDVQQRQQLDARMRSAGINPGPQAPNAAQMMFNMSLQLGRLARVLPPGADGNWGPMETPTTELEQLQLFAEGMFRGMMQNPEFRSILASVEPLLREAALFDHKFLLQAARRLANVG